MFSVISVRPVSVQGCYLGHEGLYRFSMEFYHDVTEVKQKFLKVPQILGEVELDTDDLRTLLGRSVCQSVNGCNCYLFIYLCFSISL